MPAAAAIPAAMAVVGGIAGSQGERASQSTNGRSNVFLAPESELGKAAKDAQLTNLKSFQGLVDAGANQGDVGSAAGSQRSLADLLDSFSKGGFMPTEQDTAQATHLADQLLAPSFRQQGIDANRMAAKMGRPINDPILQAKLRTAEADQRGTFIAQQAQQLPLQRLGFATQLSDVRNNLASQAMSNRQAILGIGGNILGQEQNMQLGAASRTNDSQVNQQSGGGFGGFLTGAIGGAGAGKKLMG